VCDGDHTKAGPGKPSLDAQGSAILQRLKSTCSSRPYACMSLFVESAEQAHLDGGVLLASESGRPWESAQAVTTWCGRKILTA